MTTATTTDHRRASSSQAAVARQQALAAADCQALYDFTVAVCPLAFTQHALTKSTSIRARMPASAGGERVRAIIAAADALVVDLNRRFSASTAAAKDQRRELQALLTLERLRVFRLDFGARRRFAPLRPGVCLLCNERRRCLATFRCCRTEVNDPSVCIACLERSAFYSSQHGTRDTAVCPFCKAAYPVYEAARAPKRKRE